MNICFLLSRKMNLCHHTWLNSRPRRACCLHPERVASFDSVLRCLLPQCVASCDSVETRNPTLAEGFIKMEGSTTLQHIHFWNGQTSERKSPRRPMAAHVEPTGVAANPQCISAESWCFLEGFKSKVSWHQLESGHGHGIKFDRLAVCRVHVESRTARDTN